jgi:hypothetical protein
MLLWLSSLLISTIASLSIWTKFSNQGGEKLSSKLLKLLHVLGTLTPGIGKRTVNLASSTVETKSTNAKDIDGSIPSTK